LAADIGRGDVEEFIADLAARRSPATASVRHRALQQWFAWLVDEEEIERSPMERMKPPRSYPRCRCRC
jgi:integrase/recombinase XerC